MTLFLEFEGGPVPINELSWLEIAPCGCACGIHVAESGSEVIATPEQAWDALHYFETKARAAQDKKAGYTVRLGRRSDVNLLVSDCEHDPKWGVVVTPIPDGYEWGGPNYYYKAADRKHLVSVARADFDDNRMQASRMTALCGREGPNFWARDLGALAECTNCVRAALTMIRGGAR